MNRRSTRDRRAPVRYDPTDYSSDETESESDQSHMSSDETDSTGSLADFLASDDELTDPLDGHRRFVRALTDGCTPTDGIRLLQVIETGKFEPTAVAGWITQEQLTGLLASVPG